MYIKLFTIATLVSAALLLTGVDSMALESDRNQPIRIQADSALVDESGGSSVYRGNVKIVQGSLQLLAEEVEIFVADSEVTQIIARAGKDDNSLAHYEQLRKAPDDKVTADARTITYLVQEERLHLAGDARLTQVRDEFSGELLYYDMRNGIVNLSAGEGERVNMTINPKQKQNSN